MHLLMLLPNLLIQLIKRPAAVLLGHDGFQGDAHICLSKRKEQCVEALLRELMENENLLRDGLRGRSFNCISGGICA